MRQCEYKRFKFYSSSLICDKTAGLPKRFSEHKLRKRKNMIQDFLKDLQFHKGRSLNTLKAYKRDLAFFESFQRTGRPLPDFYGFLGRKNLSPRSQARVISCVRSYFLFLRERGLPADIKGLSPPRFQAPLPRPAHLKEFQSLWLACKSPRPGASLRNRLVLACLYGLGCRVSELTALNLLDFDESDACIRITGKGGKQRLLPLPDALYRLVLLYLREARSLIAHGKSPASLFLNNRGARPSRVDIWRWLKSWSLKAGFQETKSPHAFRHGCATGLLDQGADLRAIQQLLGHADLQTTQIYTSVSTARLKKTVAERHPLSLGKGGKGL